MEICFVPYLHDFVLIYLLTTVPALYMFVNPMQPKNQYRNAKAKP